MSTQEFPDTQPEEDYFLVDKEQKKREREEEEEEDGNFKKYSKALEDDYKKPVYLMDGGKPDYVTQGPVTYLYGSFGMLASVYWDEKTAKRLAFHLMHDVKGYSRADIDERCFAVKQRYLECKPEEAKNIVRDLCTMEAIRRSKDSELFACADRVDKNAETLFTVIKKEYIKFSDDTQWPTNKVFNDYCYEQKNAIIEAHFDYQSE